MLHQTKNNLKSCMLGCERGPHSVLLFVGTDLWESLDYSDPNLVFVTSDNNNLKLRYELLGAASVFHLKHSKNRHIFIINKTKSCQRFWIGCNNVNR